MSNGGCFQPDRVLSQASFCRMYGGRIDTVIIFLRAHLLFPVSIIPLVLYTHFFIYHRRCTILAIQIVGAPHRENCNTCRLLMFVVNRLCFVNIFVLHKYKFTLYFANSASTTTIASSSRRCCCCGCCRCWSGIIISPSIGCGSSTDRRNNYTCFLFVYLFIMIYLKKLLYSVAQLAEALNYKPDGRGVHFRWSNWNYSLTLILQASVWRWSRLSV